MAPARYESTQSVSLYNFLQRHTLTKLVYALRRSCGNLRSATEVHLLDSTTIASKMAQLRGLFVLSLSLLLSACGANQVVVQSQFPTPVLDPLPVKVGVFFSEEFKTHTFVDDPEEKTERSWVVETGAAQVTLWQSILTHLFEQVVYLDRLPKTLDDDEDPGSTEASAEQPQVDAILVPT